MNIQTIKWFNGSARLIDQTKLPNKLVYINCCDVKTLWEAIRSLRVRGAPAIGVAAAFGVLLGMKDYKNDKFNADLRGLHADSHGSKQKGNLRPSALNKRSQIKKFKKHIFKVCDYLATARPTAVNLFNALDEMKGVVENYDGDSVTELKERLHLRATAMYEEDRQVCRQMGRFGARLIKRGQNLLTVCNAGALATVDYGTALGVMYAAQEAGKKFKVFVSETRPLLQGARLTTWELLRAGIDTTLICDNMAATLMKQGKVDAIFTGADRVASNGDAANKIGTYSLAVLARHHKIPFYIVAPRSSFDLKISSGKQIPIEQRSRDEVVNFHGVKTAPPNVQVYNPAFDVTDHSLITAIVTEKGIIYPSFGKNIKKIFRTSPTTGPEYVHSGTGPEEVIFETLHIR